MCKVFGQEINDETSQRLCKALDRALEVRLLQQKLIQEFNEKNNPTAGG